MTFLYIDTETTGTDPKKHAVVQIAGFLVKNGNEVQRFNLRARPFDGQLIETQALAVNGLLEKDIYEYPDPRLTYQELKKILISYEKPFLVGWNVRFDFDFLKQFFEDCGDDGFHKLVWFPPIDVAVLSVFALMARRDTLPNFRLGTVAQYLGVEFDESKLHDALYDIEITREVMIKISGKIKE